MGVTRKVIKEGTGSEMPKEGDEITVEYTGYLYDPNVGPEKDFKGEQFDSSIGREEFKTQIGRGKVIKGWDKGVLEMTLGEKSILIITGDFAYGDRGFPGLIPRDADLVFEIELKAINDKKA